eukprot:scaffold2261_cov405-Prasinococcus_capsulatus_cf.AAC.44
MEPNKTPLDHQRDAMVRPGRRRSVKEALCVLPTEETRFMPHTKTPQVDITAGRHTFSAMLDTSSTAAVMSDRTASSHSRDCSCATVESMLSRASCCSRDAPDAPTETRAVSCG